MRSDDKDISLIKMQENAFRAVKFSKISRGEYPRPPLELRPPVLALWGTSLFSLKCRSTFRINETPVFSTTK